MGTLNPTHSLTPGQPALSQYQNVKLFWILVQQQWWSVVQTITLRRTKLYSDPVM